MRKHLLLVSAIILFGFGACIKSGADTYVDPQVQLQKDEALIASFLVANNITAMKDPSGVYYQILTPGTGNYVFTANSQVTVKYAGRLLNGNTFDGSTTAVTFTLGQLIAGWQIGIPFIQKGGKIRLFIPSGYGYGARGSGSIPSNAVLDFDIELVNVQ
jgi:FKBP-type peptidyl-prolyl cis-trans isomerase FkpA